MVENSLKRQLENTRFDRALEVAESLAEHRALLTTMELERLNNILIGNKDDHDPWRQEAVTIRLPSGKTEELALIADPKNSARDCVHRATELAEGGSALEAAIDVYVGLVLAHPFQDGNRRTAVTAAHFFLRRYGIPLSARAIHDLGLPDMRTPGANERLRDTVRQMVLFAEKRGK
jgi:hypothetical protein